MIEDVPVFVLCGGQGTRLREETQVRPKPMVPIGNHPILWHILRSYAHYGFRNFVLCLGYKADIITTYFLNYTAVNSDFTIDLKTNHVTVHSVDHDQDWTVTLAFTGDLTMTGGRVARAARKYLGDAEYFAVTYGDGLTNANLRNEFMSHVEGQPIGTVLGVNPPSRFGQFKHRDNRVIEFEEKPAFPDDWINGGYFFFRRQFLEYLTTDEDSVLEREPLAQLARDGQLNLYKHSGFWACMDTQRDRDHLNHLWSTGQAPWDPKIMAASNK